MRRRSQSGITLVISLIMLIVLTLLVVSAIRFGNINLKIAGNTQAEAESSAATEAALEQMVSIVNAAEKVDEVPAQNLTVSTGGKSYTVNVAKPACTLSNNVDSSALQATASNQPCFESQDHGDRQITDSGTLSTTTVACKLQQWDVSATLTDGSSNAKVEMLQGVSLRVGAEVQCP
jgi:Tfp pilus assembly protein PilX